MVTPDRKPYAAVESIRKAVPESWLDPLLTGPNRVIGDKSFGPDIESLLNAIRARIAPDLDRLAGLLSEAEDWIVRLHGHPEPGSPCGACALVSKLRADRGEGERE